MGAALDLLASLHAQASPEKAAVLGRFFRTGPGQYGEGDRFLGVTVPQVRAVEKLFRRSLTLDDVATLLAHEAHEARMAALVHLVWRYRKARGEDREAIFRFYLGHAKRIDNWDLVDVSAPGIVGAHLVGGDASLLFELAQSTLLWERRITVVATLAFIRAGRLDETFALSWRLRGDPHDLIHKACGWMLREAGKRDEARLRAFLDANAPTLPRVTLRYALERLPAADRARYLAM